MTIICLFVSDALGPMINLSRAWSKRGRRAQGNLRLRGSLRAPRPLTGRPPSPTQGSTDVAARPLQRAGAPTASGAQEARRQRRILAWILPVRCCC